MTIGKKYPGQSRGHSVKGIAENGAIVVLEDDSRWQVYQGFLDKTRNWQASDMITVAENRDEQFPYRLINVHKNQSVEVRLT